jgi:TetR/AcrR family transcriptional regulator, mexCD-oprJ operon repressor
MSPPAVDHRRAVAERNAAAILDAAEEILARGAALTMAGIAGAAGVSRPTLYAHYKTLGDVVAAAVRRAVSDAADAIEAAQPERGPADAALERVIAASWHRLSDLEPLARAAAEHLSAEHQHEAHAPVMAPMRALVARGQKEGVFRTDVTVDWLVTAIYALIHAADAHARRGHAGRPEALRMLTSTVRDLLAGSGG